MNMHVFRGQAELISTVILVSLAVVIALGLVYYLTPLLAGVRVEQQIMSRLAQIASSLDAGVAAAEPGANNLSVVFFVQNGGVDNVTVFLGVLAVKNNNVPVATLYNYSFYNMSSAAAVLNGTAGWALLPSEQVNPGLVYVYAGDNYYVLASFVKNITGYKMFTGGIIPPGGIGIYKLLLNFTTTSFTYEVAIFVMVNGRYYEVAALPVLGAGGVIVTNTTLIARPVP